MADFVEICKVCARKAIIEGVKRIINSDKVCRIYSDLNFGVTFLEHSVVHSSFSPLLVLYCLTVVLLCWSKRAITSPQ